MNEEVHRQVPPSAAADRLAERLVRYRRFCEREVNAGNRRADSYEIARRLGVEAPLIRKDLSRFGRLGIRGTGYDLEHLGARLATVLGASLRPNLALIGVGDLGSALLAYDGFRERGFRFVAAFDTDPLKIGTERCGVVISHPSDFHRVLHGIRVDIGIITVPAASAQQAADLFARIGVEAILNMAPVRLGPTGNVVMPNVMPDVMPDIVRNLDLTLELEKLACRLMQRSDAPAHLQEGTPRCTLRQ